MLLLLAPACGDDGDERSTPSTVAVADQGLNVRTEERDLAGMPTLVVRPSDPGPFPLVVFVHGAGVGPQLYAPLLTELAEAGNVVVAPAMPGSVDRPGVGALYSLPFQPGRIRDVVSAVTATEGPQAIGAADPERVVVMGHDVGAMAVLATAFNSCCLDGRIDAVVALSGQLASFPGGSFIIGTAPLLLVHGDADAVVPFSGSGSALQEVGTSAYLLSVVDGDHSQYLAPDDDAHQGVVDAVLAFLTATVGGDPQGGLADLRTAGSSPGVRLTSRG